MCTFACPGWWNPGKQEQTWGGPGRYNGKHGLFCNLAVGFKDSPGTNKLTLWGQAHLGIHSHPTCRGRRSAAAASRTCSSLSDSSKADRERPQSRYRERGSRQHQSRVTLASWTDRPCHRPSEPRRVWKMGRGSCQPGWSLINLVVSIFHRGVKAETMYSTRWISVSIKQQLHSWSMFLSRDINSMKLQPSRRESERRRMICYFILQCVLMGSKPVWRTVPLICKCAVSCKTKGR